MRQLGSAQDEMFTFDLCIAPRTYSKVSCFSAQEKGMQDHHHHHGPPRMAK
jgi:hypothetical protein